MKFKEWLQNIFHFNKQERNGVFVLGIIISVLIIIRMCLPLFVHQDNVQFITIINTLIIIPNTKTPFRSCLLK